MFFILKKCYCSFDSGAYQFLFKEKENPRKESRRSYIFITRDLRLPEREKEVAHSHTEVEKLKMQIRAQAVGGGINDARVKTMKWPLIAPRALPGPAQSHSIATCVSVASPFCS